VTYNFEGMQKAMTYAGVTIGFRLLLSAVLHPRDQRQNIGGDRRVVSMPTKKLLVLNTSNQVNRFGLQHNTEKVNSHRA
jgi:hypothetical protein